MLARKITSAVARLRELAAKLPEQHRLIADRVVAVLDDCEEIASNLEETLEASPQAITGPAPTTTLQ